MTLTLDRMKLEVGGLFTWACSAGKSGGREIWAGGGITVWRAAETNGPSENTK